MIDFINESAYYDLTVQIASTDMHNNSRTYLTPKILLIQHKETDKHRGLFEMSASICSSCLTTLTVQHFDGDGLFLLDSLSVWEARVADVVVSGVFYDHVGEIKVSV